MATTNYVGANHILCVATSRRNYGTPQIPAVENKHFAKLRRLVFHMRPAWQVQRPDGSVPDDFVSYWVKGLPGSDAVIISLLGRKNGPNGPSEFCYYSFYGELDTPSERNNKPSFQMWLDQQHEYLQILVLERPTFDYDVDSYRPIPLYKLVAIERDVRHFISEGRTVVVMDSGGVGRTCEVCEYLKAIEETQDITRS